MDIIQNNHDMTTDGDIDYVLPQTRVALWSVPRSVSTAFFRAISNKKDIKPLLEPFASAYHHGTERLANRYPNVPIEPYSTYNDIKAVYEASYPGYEAVFAKDMSFFLVGRMEECLPEGYVHTFLIRHPAKTVSSHYDMFKRRVCPGWTFYNPLESGHIQQWKMFKLVEELTGETPLVIDSDDLLSQPREILQAYCRKTGLVFDDVMVNWQPPDLSVFERYLPWFENCLNSKGFEPLVESKPPSLQHLPYYVKRCIEESVPYYKMMYEHRLRYEPTIDKDLRL